MVENKKKENNKKNNNGMFNPVLFLMSLGAGGLSIGSWIYLNYGLEHGKGLVTFNQVHTIAQTTFQKIFYSSLEIMAVIFAIIHFVTLFYILKKYFAWKKTDEYQKYANDPLRNNGLMAIFLTLDMSLNIMFSIGNHFIIQNGSIFQTIMLPALIAWGLLYGFAMVTSLKILKIAFTTEFDMEKIHFGFMLHPFALSMIAVTGMGIAAFSKVPYVANTAFFLALMPLMTAILLTLVKTITIFQHHFKNNLPSRNFLPSTFIIMPTIMLISLSFFRAGHYLEHIHAIEISQLYYIMTTVVPFAFLFWYGLFGLMLISDYFKNFGEYDLTQWGFICPLAAFIVIGTIANNVWLGVFWPLSAVFVVLTLFSAGLYFRLLFKHISYVKEN